MPEVLVAALVVVVGLAAVAFSLVGATSSSAATRGREQATVLARDAVEQARRLSYAALVEGQGAAQVLDALGADAQGALQRREVDYAVTVTVCRIDDPIDGQGVVDGRWCALPGQATPQQPTGPGLGSFLGVLVQAAVGGRLADSICDVLGTDAGLVPALGGTNAAVLDRLTDGGAAVRVCPLPGGGSAPVAFDPNPDDLARVVADVRWTRDGRPQRAVQTTLVQGPR
jgi:type II secretory pathway pseudopilin PulG